MPSPVFIPSSTSNTSNTVTSEDSNGSFVRPPLPTLLSENYPPAPAIIPSSLSPSNSVTTAFNDIPSLHVSIEKIQREDRKTEEYMIRNNSTSDVLYYFKRPPLSDTEDVKNQKISIQDEYDMFLDKDGQPLWRFKGQDWHGITLASSSINLHSNELIQLTTTPPYFKFTIQNNVYYWQLLQQDDTSTAYSLKCFESTNTKSILAELQSHNTNIISLYTENLCNNSNPFTLTATTPKDASFIILSCILLRDHIQHLLKSLGNNPEALQFILNPYHHQQYILEPENEDGVDVNIDDEEEDDCYIDDYTKYYPGHQSLVLEANQAGHDTSSNNSIVQNRWSTTNNSFKSLELDPGCWHCWWGYKFWWSWFPCCMPGGCCDRFFVKLRGQQPSSKIINHTQGYRQQYY